MTDPQIDSLIDKVDNFEVIRDQIGGILLLELENQQTLAVAAGKDPRLFKANVFTERLNPWADFQEKEDQQIDITPIINVWYDRATIDRKSSNAVNRQTHDGTFNIDCYGCGLSTATTTGHTPGDQQARFEAHRTVRLARNILMASQYTYLGLQGIVGGRMPRDISILEGPIDANSVQHVVAVRFALDVSYNEFAPQFTPSTLEKIVIEVKRKDFTGQIYLTAEYPDPP